MTIPANLVIDKSDTSERIFFINPQMYGHHLLAPRLRPYTIMTLYTRQKTVMLWPVPSEGGKDYSVPIRLAQTHTICSGGDPKNQGFKEL
jgi:hypothetical protein